MDEMAELMEFINEGSAEPAAVETSKGLSVETPAAVQDAQDKAATTSGASLGNLVKLPNLKDVPVPSGGVGILVLIALLIVFAIAQAPGQNVSRLVLIWQALLGQASLGGDGSTTATQSSIAAAAAQPWNPYHITPPSVAPGSAWNPYGIGG